MNENSPQQEKPASPRISEDWWAVIIGLGLAAMVWLGVITRVPWPLFGLLK